jgi:hypothetical protein
VQIVRHVREHLARPLTVPVAQSFSPLRKRRQARVPAFVPAGGDGSRVVTLAIKNNPPRISA